jgi:hypothetical protein
MVIAAIWYKEDVKGMTRETRLKCSDKEIRVLERSVMEELASRT